MVQLAGECLRTEPEHLFTEILLKLKYLQMTGFDFLSQFGKTCLANPIQKYLGLAWKHDGTRNPLLCSAAQCAGQQGKACRRCLGHQRVHSTRYQYVVSVGKSVGNQLDACG